MPPPPPSLRFPPSPPLCRSCRQRVGCHCRGRRHCGPDGSSQPAAGRPQRAGAGGSVCAGRPRQPHRNRACRRQARALHRSRVPGRPGGRQVVVSGACEVFAAAECHVAQSMSPTRVLIYFVLWQALQLPPLQPPAARPCPLSTTAIRRFDQGGQWVGPSQTRFLAMADEYGVQRYDSTHSEPDVLCMSIAAARRRRSWCCWYSHNTAPPVLPVACTPAHRTVCPGCAELMQGRRHSNHPATHLVPRCSTRLVQGVHERVRPGPRHHPAARVCQRYACFGLQQMPMCSHTCWTHRFSLGSMPCMERLCATL